MEHIVLTVQNLKCGGCAHTITKKLTALNLLEDIQVEADDDTVAFSYPSEFDLIQVKKVLADMGYPVVGEANPLSAKAQSFVSCALGRMSKN